MAISLSNLRPASGSHKKKKVIGRGNASGHGTTATRGTKGQRARSGGRRGLRLRGLKRMLLAFPKVGGLRSKYGKPAVITLAEMERLVPAGIVNPKILIRLGLMSTAKNGVKILDSKDFKATKKYEISGCQISAGARAKIEALGGKII